MAWNKEQNPPVHRPWAEILIFIVLTTTIATGGFLHWQVQCQTIRQQAADELAAVADLKLRQLRTWRQEREADAEMAQKNPFLIRAMADFCQNPDDEKNARNLQNWLESLLLCRDYREAGIVNANGQFSITVAPSEMPRIGSYAHDKIPGALASGRILFSDLHTADTVPKPHIDLIIPIPAPDGSLPYPGAIFIRIDPHQFIFPLLQTWPVPNPEAEILLIRRDGDSVLYLNDLHHHAEAALSFRLPLASPGLVSAKAARGQQGLLIGHDYSNRAVLAMARKVPDTGWMLVAQVNRKILDERLRSETVNSMFSSGLLIVLCSLATLLWWKRREAAFFQAQYAAERDRLALVRHFEYLSKHANDIILLADAEHRIVEVNDSATTAYDRSRDELLGLPFLELRDPASLATAESDIHDLRVNTGRVYETRHRRKDGSVFPVEISVRCFEISGRAYYQGIIRDITERKRAETERLQFEAQMLQAQKLESLGVLAGGIAHDFNNLLMAILGNINLAAADLAENAPALSCLRDAEQASQRAAELCRQMLAYSGKGRFVVEPVNFSALIQEMSNILEHSISKKAVLRYECAEILPSVLADATQMRQILMNLVINASEALQDKEGSITVATGAMEADHAMLTRWKVEHTLAPGVYSFLEVTDTGCGMSPDTVSRIFDPFFTTKFTGRGLGLAAVQGIIRSHKGAIAVRSTPGDGSTFRIFLPAAATPAAEIHTPDQEEPDKWRGQGTILLADDEEDVRRVGERMLRQLGFEVILAQDGAEAVDLYRRHSDHIACTILDLTMPHMDGVEAFREMRQIKPNALILIASGYSAQDLTERFSDQGVSGFMLKPYSLTELTRILRKLLSAPPATSVPA